MNNEKTGTLQESNLTVEDRANSKRTQEKPAVVSSREWKQVNWFHRLSKMLLSLIAYAVFILCAFALVEFIFALAHVGEDTVVQPDPLLGYANLKNQSATIRQEGYSRSHFNSIGFRDREYAIPKPEGIKRIAVLGDSMAMAFEVPLERTFSKLLEQKLHQDGRKNIEVMNYGMTGYGTGQEYLLYLDRVAQFKPDYVLITYHLGDLDDNVAGGTNPPRPTFSVAPDGSLKTNFQDVDSWFAKDDARFYKSFEWLRRNSRILAILNKANLNLGSDSAYKLLSKVLGKPVELAWSRILSALPAAEWRRCLDELHSSEAGKMPALPGSNHTAVSPNQQGASALLAVSSGGGAKTAEAPAAAPVPVPVPAAPPVSAPQVDNGQSDVNLLRGYLLANTGRLAVTKAILRDLNLRVQANGGKLIITSLPAFSNSVFYYRELDELRQFCTEKDIQFIDATKAFPPREPMAQCDFFYDLHFNFAGHKRMADVLYSQLKL